MVGYSTEEAISKWNGTRIYLNSVIFVTYLFPFLSPEDHSLVQEFITDDFKTAVQAVFDKALQGNETENFEFPLITKKGKRIEVLLNATTRRDEQDNIIGVIGIGRDVSV